MSVRAVQKVVSSVTEPHHFLDAPKRGERPESGEKIRRFRRSEGTFRAVSLCLPRERRAQLVQAVDRHPRRRRTHPLPSGFHDVASASVFASSNRPRFDAAVLSLEGLRVRSRSPRRLRVVVVPCSLASSVRSPRRRRGRCEEHLDDDHLSAGTCGVEVVKGKGAKTERQQPTRPGHAAGPRSPSWPLVQQCTDVAAAGRATRRGGRPRAALHRTARRTA